jgi:hypothetical protein
VDYIQKIAADYVRARGKENIPPSLEIEIEAALKLEFKETGAILWNWQDERTIDLLTSVLYTHPSVLTNIVESKLVKFPSFLLDIIDESVELLTGKINFIRRPNLLLVKEVEGHTGNAIEIVNKLVQEHVSLGAIVLGPKSSAADISRFKRELQQPLLKKPIFVYAMAKALDCAVPFTIVLDDELKDIQESRELRLQPDPEAEAALLLKNLQECHLLLESAVNAKASSRTSTQVASDIFASVDPKISEADGLDRLIARTKERQAYLKDVLEKLLSSKNVKEKGAVPYGRRETRPPSSGKCESHGRVVEFPPRQADKYKLLGLAFSGGGIRSATFNLGILQALSDLDMLRHVDYVSAVSGGSYIAAWLGAWCKRQQDGVRRVQRWLSPWRSPDPTTEQVKPIWFLREYSNYLTPKKGFFSADTWSLGAIWIRNTLLNQIILVSFLAGILLVPRCLFHYARYVAGSSLVAIWALDVLLVVSLLIGLNLARFERSSSGNLRKSYLPKWLTSQAGVQLSIVGCLTLVAYWGSAFLSNFRVISDGSLRSFVWSRSTLFACFTVFICLSISQISGRFHRCFYFHNAGKAPRLRRFLAFVVLEVVNAITGTLGGSLFAVLRWWSTKLDVTARPLHVLIWGPPLLVLTVAVIVIVQLGLLGVNFPDERREWWSRLGAWLCIYAFAWLGIFAFAFYGPWLVLRGLNAWGATGGVVWAATTIWGVIKAQGVKTPLRGQDGISALKWGTKIAPYVFVVGLLLIISFGLQSGIAANWHPTRRENGFAADSARGTASWQVRGNPILSDSARLDNLLPYYRDFPPLVTTIVTFALALFFAWRVDINEFSMHHLYRNRLMRCYLGATRGPSERKANPFTGFDSTDDLRLSQLRARDAMTPKEETYCGPYLIVNTALNLVAGKELAWQERKAESFFFAPRYCGYEVKNPDHRSESEKWSALAYRPTQSFGYRNGGVGVATAMGISGAAANPNMGYHSSPPLAFLMTLFNVRLGWWIGNPRDERTWKRSSPRIGLLYLLSELIGATKDTSAYVNLSDGGHFENLGVYELIRRRCRYIIACDSEQDRSLTFGGLGNLVRKCRTDFGVDIKLHLDQIRPFDGTNDSKNHCVVGDIVYPGPEPITGMLLYVKTSITRDEPVDVLEYGWRINKFPHETTADQWFDESQFESYRTLGYHAMHSAFRNAELNQDLELLFTELKQIWYPPSAASQKSFTRHAQSYQDIMERARKDRHLQFMDPVLCPDYDKAVLLATQRAPIPQKQLTLHEYRSAFYFCNSLLQLMENVYLDLQLEQEYDQPQNQGWMQLFRFWCESEIMQTVWKAAGKTYGARFRVFCQRKLFPNP